MTSYPDHRRLQAVLPTLASLRTRAGATTHVGKVRQSNEDQFLIGDIASAMQVKQASMLPTQLYVGSSPLSLLIVADGMGGHASGERAAALAVCTIDHFILRALGHVGTLGIQHPAELLRTGFQIADNAVIETSERRASLAGMGTTMTVALVIGTEAHIAHAGDSRAYLFRSHNLWRLTRDHTLANALQGRELPREATEQAKHVVTNAVGGGAPGVSPDVARVDLQPGDQLLLCTDGLTNMVDDGAIAPLLAFGGTPEQASRRLVDAALANGGEDNVTALVARLEAA